MTRPTLDVLLPDIAENPVALARFAELLLARGQREQAWTLCERAIALAPGDAEVQAIAAPIFSHQVPGYHFVMVRDTERNALYEEVLRRAIRPDFPRARHWLRHWSVRHDGRPSRRHRGHNLRG